MFKSNTMFLQKGINLTVKSLLLVGFLFLALFELLPLNIESYGVFILLLIGVLNIKKYKFSKNQITIIFFLSLFSMVEILTLLYTEDVDNGLKLVLRRLSIILMPISFILLEKTLTIKLINKFFKVYVISLLGLGALFFSFLINFFELYSFEITLITMEKWNFKHSILDGFYRKLHPTYMSMGFLMGNLILISKFNKSRNKVKSILNVIVICFFTLIICTINSRIVVFASFVTMPLLIILKRNFLSYKKLFVILITTVLLTGFSFISLNQNLKAIIKNDIKKALKINDDKISRIEIYDASLGIVKSNFLLGVGIGDIQTELIESYTKKGFESLYTDKFFNSHNQYLHYFLGGGILLFSLFISTFFYLFYISISSSDHLLFCFLTMMALIMLTENILNRINGIFFYSIFTSLLYFRCRLTLKDIK